MLYYQKLAGGMSSVRVLWDVLLSRVFDQPLGTWDVSSVKMPLFNDMFEKLKSSFNQDIADWDVGLGN